MRLKVNIEPATIPGTTSGIMIFRNVMEGVAQRSSEARIKFKWILCKLAYMGRII